MVEGTGTQIDAEGLRQWLEDGRPVEVIDIRPNADYKAWHIPGSRNVDAYDAIYANSPGPLADYEAPQAEPVVVVCFVGQTSKIAVQYLRSRGIPALSLSGGMRRWSLAWNTAEITLEKSMASLIQVRRTGKGCLSYMIGSQGEALVIDPSVNPQVYLKLAAKNGLSITKVLDTHIHADHLSRSLALAQLSGAVYFLPHQERVAFEYQKIENGDNINIGGARLKAFQSPGHTFESMGFILDNQAIFTGDTLFLDSVGRPDLKADPAETEVRARLLYKTLMEYLSLDASMLVLPCHTSQPVPFDRSPIAATLEEVVRNIKALSYAEETFVTWILGRIPPTPPNYEEIVSLNEAGELPGYDPIRLEAGANQCAI
jgi:glyoxylase-like metal-dependent hydrolase (beta-lactamase superfamily II)/rhodanese-related sulfurtransferase